MSGTTLPIILAVVSLAGTLIVAAWSAWSNRQLEDLKNRREVKKEVRKYSGPLLVAAWDLQDRLNDLVDFDLVSLEELNNTKKKSQDQRAVSENPDVDHKLPPENKDSGKGSGKGNGKGNWKGHDKGKGKGNGKGRENALEISGFMLAQFLAWTHILKEETQFLAWSEDKHWKGLRSVIYKIEDEIDRRIDRANLQYAAQPADRLVISENAVLPGETGMHAIGWTKFKEQYESTFQEPLDFLTSQIEKSIKAKAKEEKVYDERLRRMQHLIVDLIKILDPEQYINLDRPANYHKCVRARWCDCDAEECKKAAGPTSSGITRRQRHNNYYGRPELRSKIYPPRNQTAEVKSSAQTELQDVEKQQ